MGMFDQPANPSLGQFEAPDPSRFEPPQPSRRRAWLIPVLMLLIYLLRFELHRFRGRGWLAVAAAIGVVALGAAELVFSWMERRARLDEDPYSKQQRITR